jgi:hypothetical protein
MSVVGHARGRGPSTTEATAVRRPNTAMVRTEHQPRKGTGVVALSACRYLASRLLDPSLGAMSQDYRGGDPRHHAARVPRMSDQDLDLVSLGGRNLLSLPFGPGQLWREIRCVCDELEAYWL